MAERFITAERSMVFRCGHCGAAVTVHDNTSRLTCGECGTEMTVERRHGTISLRPALTPANTVESQAEPIARPSCTQLISQLDQLQDESIRVLRRQVAVGIAGSICGLMFAYFGISNLLNKDLGTGVTLLVCGAGSLWFVRFVMQDATAAGKAIAKTKKELERQIAEAGLIEEQQEIVKQLALDRVALELYLNEVKFYPSWIQHSRTRVPAQITEAFKSGTDAVRIKTSKRTYVFEWDCSQMPDGRERGELTVSTNGSIVLRVQAIVSSDQWLTSAAPYSVLDFVQGDWIRELLAISTEAKKCRRDKLS